MNGVAQLGLFLGDFRFGAAVTAVDSSKNGGTYRHAHAGYELTYVVCGRCSVALDDALLFLGGGDALLLAPGVPHLTALLDHAPCEKYSITLTTEPIEGAQEDPLLAESRKLLKTLRTVATYRKLSSFEASAFLFPKICAAQSVLEANGYLLLLLAALEQALLPPDGKLQPQTPADARIALIEHFFDFQEADPRPKTAACLAELLGVSKRHMGRLLHTLFRASFQTLLSRSRMDAANFYLTESALSMGEISRLLGYSSETGFFVAYRKRFRTTPGEFRNAWRKLQT